MAKIKPEKAYTSAVVTGFSGLGTQNLLEPDGAADMKNFRIARDGTLETRFGYRELTEFPAAVRGFWEGQAGGESVCLVVAGNTVYRLTPSTGEYSARNVLSTDSGRVYFFTLRGLLILADGDELYVYRASVHRFAVLNGYAPLYGAHWSVDGTGLVNEPLNLFTERFRVEYYNITGSPDICLPQGTEHVYAVRVNGVLVTDFTFNAATGILHINAPAIGSSVEVGAAMPHDATLSGMIRRVSCGISARLGGTEELVLGTSEDARAFVTCEVTDSMLAGSTALFSQTDPLYAKAGEVLAIGTRSAPLCAFCRFCDGVLAFSSEGAWYLNRSGDNPPESVPVVTGFGCSAPDAVALCGDSPVTINREGVFSLSSSLARPETVMLRCLSAPIREILPPELPLSATVFWDSVRGEILLRDVEEGNGTVWIYDAERKEWYKFDDIYADFFFHCTEGMGFANGAKLCVFDEDLHTDEGRTIVSVYRSGFFALNPRETWKRPIRATICANIGAAPASMTVETDRSTTSFSIVGSGASAPETVECRIGGSRHRMMRYQITLQGRAKSKIYGVSFYANR